ncbi:MAG: ATP-binding protein [Candidatus Aminicenantes bacterium]|nr:MAG: ATP-binding protein [Candidatus Aminicenantes bacterium]
MKLPHISEVKVTAMKERISVKNFSVIDSIEMDVKPITILIGPQSTGKSLMAKLVYFFKSLPAEMTNAVIDVYNKRELDGMIRTRFNKIFPQYLLKDKIFNVTYYYDDQSISITNEKAKTYKSLKISYSRSILSNFNALKRTYRNTPGQDSFSKSYDRTLLRTMISNELNRFFYGINHLLTIYIPAGRSYFVNVKEKIFSMLFEDYNIDYMLKQFGSVLESFKQAYAHLTKEKNNPLCRFFSEILGGEYGFDKEKEWISMKDNRFVLLKDSSSGQQEVVPLVVSLIAMTGLKVEGSYTFIEEPEAHLFPESQGKIVDFLGIIYNTLKRNAGFFITTHSPYILTFLNNFIQAENVYNQLTGMYTRGSIDAETRDKQIKALDKLVNPGTRVAFDDVCVYVVRDGTGKDIKNYEHKLIDASVIDDVSNSTARIFDGLLDLSFGE